MKKITVFLLLAMSLLACQKNEKNVISGKFSNYYGMPVKIIGEGVYKDLIIKEDGSFSDTLSATSNYYNIVGNGIFIPFYLTKGNNLTLHADFSQNPVSTEFVGKDAPASHYLQAKTKLRVENEATYTDVFKQSPNDFLKSMQEIENKFSQLLKNSSGLTSAFVKLEEKENKFYTLELKTMYPIIHERITQQVVETPQTIAQELSALDLDNAEDFEKHPAYRSLVMSVLSKKMFELQSGKFSEDYPKHWLNYLNDIKNLKTKALKKEFAPILVQEMDASNSKESNAIIMSILKETVTDSVVLKEMEQKYASIEKLYAGNEAPNFNFENFAGGKTSLESLRGKLVYIDVWATWCAPCIKEMPALQNLEKEYHGKDIVFVSMSIDQKYDDWKKYLAENTASGIQLYADLNAQDNFIQAFNVKTIPHFILLDKNGKIINANAPRPSDSTIKELINNNL